MVFPFTNTTPEIQQQLSLDRLLEYIRKMVHPYSPYYRKQFGELGIDPASLKTYEDFRRIPITYKEDIVPIADQFALTPRMPGEPGKYDTEEIDPDHWASYAEYASKPGIRDVFFPRTEQQRMREAFLNEWLPVHFQMSGGSTGKSLMTAHTRRDVEVLFARAGAWWYAMRPDVDQTDKWLNLMPAAPHLGIYAGILIPLMNGQPNFNTFGGKVMPTERQIEIVAEDNFALMLTIPSYLTHWLRTAKRMIDEGRIAPITSFRIAYCVAEPITDAYKRVLHELFDAIGSKNVEILEGMGSTELRSAGFYECYEGSKLHFDPEYFFAEILDPETKEPVPWGQPGVFVWSHIDWRGTAILRYWTGDYVSGGMQWGTCPHCLLTIPRLITPIWRAAYDSTKFRGAQIEYVALQDCVRSVVGITTFQAHLRKEAEGDQTSRDILDVFIALAPGEDPEKLKSDVRAALKARLEITPDTVQIQPVEDIDARLFARKLKAEWVVDSRPRLA